MSYTEDYLQYVAAAVSAYQTVHVQKEILAQAGFTQLHENAAWKLKAGGAYYVIRNSSAIIAFRIPKKPFSSARIVASHADAPAFKIKNAPDMKVENAYVKWNVEGYGGAILSTWFDRPLSVAGRVFVKSGAKITERPVDLSRDICMIDSLAIHMDRDMNKGHAWEIQKELLPLVSTDADVTLTELLAKELKVKEDAVVSFDLFLYNRQEPRVWGAKQEFLSAPRIDDTACAYASLRAITDTAAPKSLALHAVFDNEEVGSSSMQGASSTFLSDTIHRIALAMSMRDEEELCMLADSFLLSADNGHALHPNYPQKCDPTNRPVMGRGVLLKFAGNQKYTTDAYSAAEVRRIAQKAGIALQDYHNQSDIPGGSTLGNLLTHRVSVHAADVGLAQLAMHSAYETCGCSDLEDLFRLSKAFFKD